MKESSPQHQKDLERAEIDRRLAALEKSTADLNNRIFDSHKWFVTVLFSAVAVLLGVYGVLSRIDVRDSTNEMEKRVEKATTEMELKNEKTTQEMEKRIQSTLGEALKRPLLEIVSADGQSLDGKTNIGSFNMAGTLIIYSLFLTNSGDKRTEALSVRISTSGDLQADVNFNELWDIAPSGEKDFDVSFYLRRSSMTVAPHQKINLPQISFRGDLSKPKLCELEVFYGGENPLRTRFFISK